jgi:hypothetical protein
VALAKKQAKNPYQNGHARVAKVGVGHLRGMNAAAKNAVLIGTLRNRLKKESGVSSPCLQDRGLHAAFFR